MASGPADYKPGSHPGWNPASDRLLKPPSVMDRGALVIGTDDLRFRLHCLNRGLFNVSTLRRRHFDGALYSTKNSGAHWLKYMLGLTIAELHDLAPPEHLDSHDIIGGPKSTDFPPGIPRIVTAHSIAHLALRWPAVVRRLALPQCVILVRDIRVVLVSLFEKGPQVGR